MEILPLEDYNTFIKMKKKIVGSGEKFLMLQNISYLIRDLKNLYLSKY